MLQPHACVHQSVLFLILGKQAGIDMLRFYDSQKRLHVSVYTVVRILYNLVFVQAFISEVPGLAFTCHAGVVGSIHIEIIIFNLIIQFNAPGQSAVHRHVCISSFRLACVWIRMYICDQKELRCTVFFVFFFFF